MPMCVYRQWIWSQVKVQLRRRCGLVGIDQLCVFYDKQNSRVTLHLIGITLEQTTPAASTSTSTTTTAASTMPNVSAVEAIKTWAQATTPLLQSLIVRPIMVSMSFIVNHTALHIDKLTIATTNSNNNSRSSQGLVVTLDHIYLQSSLNVSQQRQPSGQLFQDQQRVFTVQLQVGPVTVVADDNGAEPLVEMTTTCLVMASCQLATNSMVLEGMDLDIQLGIISMSMDACMAHYQRRPVELASPDSSQQHDLDMSASRIMRLGIKINSISVTVQKMAMENQHMAIRMELNTLKIQALLRNRVEPRVELNTELILLCLHQHRLIEIPTMELTAALPPPPAEDDGSRDHYASSDTLPHTDLLSVTWIVNMPLLTLPLKSRTFLDTLAQLQHSTTSTTTAITTNSGLPQKRIFNVPVCSLAIVLNSAKMDLLDVDNDARHGYMSSKSLIVRFSGEYMKKSNRNSSSSFDDVPSTSSSSSASRFDSWFAQEEYKWLSGGSFSHLTAKNRSSFHESTPKSSKSSIPTPTPTPTPQPLPPQTPTPAVRWLHLLGRVSRRHQPSSPAPLTRPQQRHQKWIYRLSLKVIMQHVKFGYQRHQKVHDFIQVKNAVFMFKSGMHVVQNQVVFAPGNVIQSEAAIDKPLINVWDTHHGTALSASVFWLASVPEALKSLRNANSSNSNSGTDNNNNNNKSDWMQVVAQSISFSLDVTQGSIVAWSVDTARPLKSVQAPHGFIDNAPTDTVYTRMILDTQKLTFVCEGPYAAVDQHFDNEWKTRCHMEKLYLHQSSSCKQQGVDMCELLEKPEKQHVILWISQLNFTTKYWQAAAAEMQLSVVVKVKKFGISYSIRNHYACLLLSRSLFTMKHQLRVHDNKEGESGLKHQQSTAITPMPLVLFNVSVGRGDVQIGLPQESKLYLRMDEVNVNYTAAAVAAGSEQTNMLQFRNIMLLGVSPTHQAKWEQLVELDQVKIAKTTSAIELKAKKIFASVPYKFVLAEVIDSVIGLVKAIKELHARILEQDPARRVFTYFGPSLKNDPIAIPHIKLRAKVFTIHFDDDPFEARLRNILRTGLQEQQRRLAYRETLDEKIYDMLHATAPASPESSSSSVHHHASVSDNLQSIGTSSSTIHPQQRDDTDTTKLNRDTAAAADNAELYAQINKAQQNLLAYYSEFWIKHIDETNQQEAQFFEALHVRNNYRNTATSDAIDHALDDGDSRRHDRFLLSKTFTIDIVPRPLHPPLANFTAQYVKVSFKPASFRLQETRSFIHMVGSGVPLDYDFSILIPFHLSIKASKTWIKVRDYPLPLLYVPPSDQGRVAWALEGDYVVGDELGNSGGSRVIPIAIIPVSTSTPGYCLSAVRTASPLKFYSVIDYRVLTGGMSMICWSVSYNPAIQDILRVLDTLTAAQVDPSPRIGFWDKVRFMIHSRIKIDFGGGGGKLAFVVKGTRDPYQLLERGAGLAKIWSDDVVWLLGYENEQNEFMQIISQSYAFGVPDLIHGGFVPQLPDALQYKQDKMCADDYRVFLKIALKLSDGVRMGIGLSYERLSCHANDVKNHNLCDTCQFQQPHLIDRCRSQAFMPHYHVLFQSVQQVNAHFDMATYDAFRGFRSDFIHLSFSIVKMENDTGSLESPDFSQDDPYSGNVSQNAMYLSPCFVSHFQQWFRLFGSPVSVPIRQGKLFPTAEVKAKSFGELLNTIKYKIVVNPLAIGFFISDQETYLNMKGGGSVGLKARVNSFSVDLHSRREMTTRPSEVQDDSLKTEINFHEAEVELSDIDLRVIRAHHRSTTNTATAAAAAKPPQSARSVAESTVYSYQDQEASFYEEEENHYSFQWIDAKDFVILDAVHKQPFLSRSKMDVFPFAFSPLFYYMKQHDEPGAEKRDYLRRTHECTIGNGMDSHEFQKTYLNQRAADLDKVIEDHDKQLDIIIHAMQVYKNEKEDLSDEHASLVKKIDHLRVKRYMLHTYIAHMILENELNMTTEDADTRGSPHTTTSSICRRDELSRWEMLMGRFKDRYFVHNPQIIWNSSVRDAVYYMRDMYNHRSVQSLNLSARCFKFLEDLVRMAEKQQQWKPDVPNTTTAAAATEADAEASPPNASSSASTQAMIEKLLSERAKKFVAYNEREEDKKQPKESISNSPSSNTSYVFDDNADNVNDPDYQYENIPDAYEMQSSYLIDMINPQFICQSERGLDHLILLTNDRIHVKGFRIIDNSTSGVEDKDVRLVKSRIIANLDNAQLLVARKIEEVHSYHALAPNCYGQFQERHWAVWTQPEQLWYYRELKHFENFQRIATQLSGTMQLDLYNHLRIKINKYNNTLRKSPFEDRTNTIQMHFPHVKITLNSLQSHILYYTTIHLLLGSDRSPREKTKLNKFRDVMLAAERSDLAETVKQVGVLQNRSRYLLDLHSRFLSELPYLDAFGLREFNKNKKKMSESLEKLYMVVDAIRSIQTFRRDIHLEESDSAKRFIFTSAEIIWEAIMDDESSLCEWKLINTRYVRLDKPNGSRKNTIEVDQFQIKNTSELPVFTNVLDAYLDPSSAAHQQEPDFSRHKMLSGVLDSLPPVGGIPVIQHLEINLLPLHLQISLAFGTAIKDYFFPRISSTATADQQALSGDEPEEQEEEEEEEEEDEQDEAVVMDNSNMARTNSNHTSVRSFGKREGSFASFDMIARKVKDTVVRKRKGKADELTIMKKRSSTNRTFIYVRIPAAKHCISFQGPTPTTFYNLYNFPFKQPKLEYRNKTWSVAEMTEEIQKQFTRAILRHSPALLKKKLLTKNSRDLPAAPAAPTIQRATSVKSQQSSTVHAHSNIDLMDDSVIYNENDDTTSRTKSVISAYTEEEEGDDLDVQSLYSNAPEEEQQQQRLAELQTIKRKESHNVDEELLAFYAARHKPEQTTDELTTRNSQILFGSSYHHQL